MFSVRRLFIFQERTKGIECPKLIFSKKFQTVENRFIQLFRSSSSKEYQQRYNSFSDERLSEIFLNEGPIQFEEDFEPHENFIFSSCEFLNPMMYIKKGNLLYICVPLIEEQDFWSEAPALSRTEMPSTSLQEREKKASAFPYFSASLALLQDLSSFWPSNPDITPRTVSEFSMFVSKAMPFGKPNDSTIINVAAFLKQGFPSKNELATKRPAWKPFLHKGAKQRIEIKIQDRIRCIQYQSQTIPDQLCINSGIICRFELAELPEVTLGLRDIPPVTSVSFDSSVQLRNEASTTALHLLLEKIVCHPPLDSFVLSKFQVNTQKISCPLRSTYSMKVVSPKEIKVLVQLVLNDKKKNNFAYCEIDLPFFSFGKIESLELNANVGSMNVSGERNNTVKWTIGQKFSSKSLEAVLQGTIFFSGTGQEIVQEPYLNDHTCYAKMKFKMLGETLSGAQIDSTSIQVYPTTKFDLKIDRETVTDEYIIWNSLTNSSLSH